MTPVQVPGFMSIGSTVIELRVFNNKNKKYIKHGQNVKIHFSITLDIMVFSWCTPLFQHALSCKNAESQIHLKRKVKTISLCIAE